MIEENNKCAELQATYRANMDAQKRAAEKLQVLVISGEKLSANIADLKRQISALKSGSTAKEPSAVDNNQIASAANEISIAVNTANEIAKLESELLSQLSQLANVERGVVDLKNEINALQLNIDSIVNEMASIGCQLI